MEEKGLLVERLPPPAGFASVDAGSREKSLTTWPLRFSGRHLSVNADAAGGNLQVETLTLYGAPIPGFTRADCPMIDADSTDQSVAWTSGKTLDAVDQPIRPYSFHIN